MIGDAPHFPQPLDDALSPVDPDWLLAYTDGVARYAQQLWAVEMRLPDAPAPVCPKTVPYRHRPEIRHLVGVYARAMQNQCER